MAKAAKVVCAMTGSIVMHLVWSRIRREMWRQELVLWLATQLLVMGAVETLIPMMMWVTTNVVNLVGKLGKSIGQIHGRMVQKENKVEETKNKTAM